MKFDMIDRRFVFLLVMLIGFSAVQAQIDVSNDEVILSNAQGDEEEIEFPEAMTAEVDSLLNLYHAKTYLDADRDCKLPDFNPTFSTSVFIERLSKMPTAIEMPYNDIVQTFIDRYTGRLRRSVSYMLGAANFYMPIFEEALEAYQLPLELKYLPVIESALKPTAVSRVGATGLWQFMLTTGREYGLEINTLVDERRDPLMSSYAAAHYLSDLYKIFGDWNLVIAAYNCGPATINKAIHRADGAMDYWAIYPYLPKETRGYVPAFIAANYVMTYYCEHNICPMKCELPAKTDTVMVSTNVNLNQIAAVLNLDIDMLRALNPLYRRDVVPGATKPSPIRLHANDLARFIDMQDSICNYNVAVMLPKRATVAVDVPASTSKSRSSRGAKTVTIRKGDTLGAIAKRNGTTVAKLRKLNKISGNSIRAGKKLRVR
jgi:membrane-bound lytic murein transglycosylase D